MMPDMDGIETCREMKKINWLSKSIIVFLTARSEDYSQIAGLDAGADDYISKPVRPSVFISRVKALLRRFDVPVETSDKLTVAGLEIDRERYRVIIDKREILLPKKVFELLWLLMSKANKVLTRDEIYTEYMGRFGCWRQNDRCSYSQNSGKVEN